MQKISASSDVKEEVENASEQLKELSESMEEVSSAIESKDGREKNFTRILAENGYRGDTIITDKSTIEKLTEQRMKILETLAGEEVESIQELAEKLERDKGNLSRDLEILSQENMIEYEHEKNRKIPKLKHKYIFMKPIKLG